MGISSQGSEGCSGLNNLKDLIEKTKIEYQRIIPNFNKWPCPFCFTHSKTIIQCRTHILRDHPANCTSDKNFLNDFKTIYNQVENSISVNKNSVDGKQAKSNLHCTNCDFVGKNEKGLKIHWNKKHSSESYTKNESNDNQSTILEETPQENTPKDLNEFLNLIDEDQQTGGLNGSERVLQIECTSDKSTDQSHYRAKCPFCDEDSTKTYQMPNGLKIHCRRMHKDENLEDFLSRSMTSHSENFASVISNLKQSCKIIKRIPKGARIMVATQYSKSIDKCVKQNTFSSWKELLTLPYKLLKLPPIDKKERNSNRTSLVRVIKDNCLQFSAETNFNDNNSTDQMHHTLTRNNLKQNRNLPKIIESKLADFDIKGAVNIISSNETVAPNNEETFAQLQKKHPTPRDDLVFPPAPDNSIKAIQVDQVKVQNGIQSFPAGSSGGIDGLRPQHMKDLISFSSGEAGQKCLSSITDLCNMLLCGKLNSETCPFFFGANLCAFLKKDGGIRPIAVGCTFRRLSAKLGCFEMKEKLSAYLLPHQVGFAFQECIQQYQP